MIYNCKIAYSDTTGEKYPRGTSTANAIYTKATNPNDQGNPLLEALPSAHNKEETCAYFLNMDVPIDIEVDTETQLDDVEALEDLRIPLPFTYNVERSLRSCFIKSCRRQWRKATERANMATVNDSEIEQSIIMEEDGGADPGNGFAVLGVGGSGKSACVDRLLERYPQVIIHDWGIERHTQILWIKVNAPSNGSLDSLYTSIGRAIDAALGNTRPVYETLISKKTRVDDKANVIATLIRQFFISAIIFDEIQNLTATKNKASSFKSLLQLTNPTKCALIMVGTQEAYNLVFKEFYVARRCGDIIRASEYCTDMDTFDFLARAIMSKHWSKAPIAVTNGMVKAMYAETHGFIERMITLWKNIQKAYISSEGKAVIDENFIHTVSTTKQPLMAASVEAEFKEDVLACQHTTISKEDSDNMIVQLSIKNRADTIGNILRTADDQNRAQDIFIKVKNMLLQMYDGKTLYNDITIMKAVIATLKTKKMQHANEATLTSATILRLSVNKNDSRPA